MYLFEETVPINLPSTGDSRSVLWELDPCHLSRKTEVKSKGRVLLALDTAHKQVFAQSCSAHAFRPPCARPWEHSLPTMALAPSRDLAATLPVCSISAVGAGSHSLGGSPYPQGAYKVGLKQNHS